MNWKAYVSALGLALIFVLLPSTLAGAEFRGTDMWSTLAPGGPGGLVDRYPISYYFLDYHVDGPSIGLSGPSAGDMPAMVIQLLAAGGFMVLTFFMRATISAFDWAFNIDVINGRHGLIGPVGDATHDLYATTVVPLLGTAVVLFGAWLAIKTVSRKFSEAGVGLVRVVCLSVIAIAIILNPGPTIGQAMSLSNGLAAGVASGTTGGNGASDVSARIFRTFIKDPWTVLEFGGLERCVSAAVDSEGYPKDASPNSGKQVCRNAVERYAPEFLEHPPGSDDRKKVYEQIKDGKGDFDKYDAPAVDMMQAGGALQRLGFVILLGLGIVAAILLLGLICVASLFVQLGLLVLVVLTPAMLIAALIPALHGIFWSWARWIGKLLVAKVVYAIVLSAALAISAALTATGGVIGYLPAFGLQAALFWGLFLKRKALAETLTSRKEYSRTENSTKAFVGGAATAAVGAVAAPVAAAAAAKEKVMGRQQAAGKPDSTPHSSPEAPATTGSGPIDTSKRTPDSSSPPASAGREYSPNPPNSAKPPANTSTTVAKIDHNHSNQQAGGEPVPTKSFREEYQQAREAAKPREYGQERPQKPMDPIEADRHSVHNGARAASSLADQIKQERAKTPS